MLWRRMRPTGRLLATLLLGTAVLSACRDEPPPPIVVEDRVVKVHNQTDTRWTDVRVWLNDHYVVGAPAIEPGGRMTVQQRDFTAAMGQKFDPARQSPYGVLLTARAGEEEVRVVWGKPYKR